MLEEFNLHNARFLIRLRPFKGIGTKIFRGGEGSGGNGKTTEKLQKRPKIALLTLFQGATEKRSKSSKKRPKNSTIKPLSTISVPCTGP